jgi:hypothetical protein
VAASLTRPAELPIQRKGPIAIGEVKQTLPALEAANGGFPEPPAGPVRVVAARHDGCGEATRVRLPSALPARVVRRLRCAGCDVTYEAESVRELGVEEPDRPRRRGRLLRDRAQRLRPPRVRAPRAQLSRLRAPHVRVPRPRLPRLGSIDFTKPRWRFATIPLAALAVIAVIAGLMVLQRAESGREAPADDQRTSETASAASATDAAPDAPAETGGRRGAARQAELVRGSRFSVALPPSWERVPPQGGATFAAVSAAGDADATLWIERDPGLDFARFEARSLDQLRALAGSARVVERVAAPTAAATVVRLAAVAPPDQPEFEVTLRASGPYRYYLATTVQPDASRAAIEGSELIHGSFTPEAASRAGS